MKPCVSFVLAIASACLCSNPCSLAGPVTDWHTFRTPASTLSGQGTANPVFGSAALPAHQGYLVGYFDALSLTNEGDRITFSFQVSFTDATGMGNGGDNFRFALFDLNGQSRVATENSPTAGIAGQTDNWRGYWFGARNGTGTGSAGSIRERFAGLATGHTNIFATASPNNSSIASLATPGGTPVTLLSSNNPAASPVYVGQMALERTPAGVALAGYFAGGGGSNIFAANDNATPWPVNYEAVAYLSGGALNLDQMNLQNVSVDYGFASALQITNPPQNLTVVAGQPARFSVGWTGRGIIPTFKWFENDLEIAGETNSTYTIPSASALHDGIEYKVQISNVFGDEVLSAGAFLTVISDTTPPIVLSASSLASNSLNVIFSEPVDRANAEAFSSYTLAGNTVAGATLINPTNVLVEFDLPITSSAYSLAVQQVQDTALNTIETTNVNGIAHGFQRSVGIGVLNGFAYAFNESVIVHASGADIFDVADQFHYVYKPMAGDFDIAVRIRSLLNTHSAAKAGIMARVNTLTDSRNVTIEATPTQFILQYRTNTAENTFALGSPRPSTAFPNNWVRLARTGSTLTAYSSTSPGTWTLIGSHDTASGAEGAYPAEILVGLAVTSHNASQLTRAEFSSFGGPLIKPTLTLTSAGADFEVSWPLASLGFTLQATPSMNPVTWTNIPNSSATNRVLVPSSGNLFFRAYLE